MEVYPKSNLASFGQSVLKYICVALVDENVNSPTFVSLEIRLMFDDEIKMSNDGIPLNSLTILEVNIIDGGCFSDSIAVTSMRSVLSAHKVIDVFFKLCKS